MGNAHTGVDKRPHVVCDDSGHLPRIQLGDGPLNSAAQILAAPVQWKDQTTTASTPAPSRGQVQTS
eukprot:905566-Lingulodinium_polyedra.AAC.1